MSANEPQTLRDDYSQATKILDDEYKPEKLDDVIKTCENLHVEEHHQLKILLQKFEHLFDGTLAFTELILSIDNKTSSGKVAFSLVKGCKNKDYADGNASMARERLKNKFEP
jgi:hypothetical protein